MKEPAVYPCPACNGTGQNKWGDSCNECHGEGVIYEEAEGDVSPEQGET